MELLSGLIAFVTALVTSLLGAYVADRRFQREYRLQDNAILIARRLLTHSKYRLRTFKTISHHLGGFQPDELRKLLVQAGAVRFEDGQGVEVWGLLERTWDLVEQELGTSQN